ncbi:hypothetical protein [Streptomyces bauhiniae]|uniref:hypothetical protein n=1 Tax=Streptomyces bauhiniae TaxID=2340725 RepID=UPI001FCA658B|nr:hypothetical protein [Streptomyces bauhiniae]
MARQVIEKTLNEASVTRLHAAEQDVAAVLHDRLPLRGDVVVKAVTVSLRVDDDVVAAARRKEQTRYDYELDELERRQARARMEFLRDELLVDPSSARLYSLLQLSPRLGGPLPSSDPDELVREVHRWHPTSRWVLIAQTLHTFSERVTEDQAEDLLKLASSMMELLGHRRLAANLSAAMEAR